ncbi:TPA: glycosyltransferase [Klebsiella michiganensis]|uniref:glycosyltransferase n=1 Tax=Klebsiella TaxID=570 RepID=UPI001118C578|nr:MULTISPECIES: glycosyltransferase [Klebsiella]HBM2932600.1 glycosyltransferase [Klebsiella michiganensis]HDX9063733.1 glycosyltransferase [Klebsiella michiganensis]
MSNESLVSIYIITRNRLPLLKRCVQSVCEQTYSNIEIIIVDDNSSDGTVEYLVNIAAIDPRIKYFFNDRNRGACYCRNLAIENATGEYITGVDDDDYFMPERVSLFIENKQLLSEFCALFTDSIWKVKTGFNKASINRFFPNKITHKDLLAFNFIGNQIFTTTKNLKENKFDVEMPAWQDLDCWYNLLKNTNKKAYKLDKHNYVQDVSHDHERISLSKKEKVIHAYQLFCSKNNLSESEKCILSNHFCSYKFKMGSLMYSGWQLLFKHGIIGMLILLRNIRELYRN